jgi:hypothetical protein
MSIIYPLALPQIVKLGPRTFKFRGVDVVGEVISPFSGQAQEQQWPGQWWELELGYPPMFRPQAEQLVSFLLALHGKFGSFLAGDPLGQVPMGSALGVPVTGGGPTLSMNSVTRTSNVVTCVCPYDPTFAPYFFPGASISVVWNPDASFSGSFLIQTIMVITFAGHSFFQITWGQVGPDTGTETGTGAGEIAVNLNQPQSNTLWTTGWQIQQVGALLPGDYIQVGSGTTQRLYKAVTQVDADNLGNAAIDIFPAIREVIPDGTALVLQNTAGCFRLSDNKREWDVDHTRTYGISFKAREAI